MDEIKKGIIADQIKECEKQIVILELQQTYWTNKEAEEDRKQEALNNLTSIVRQLRTFKDWMDFLKSQ